MQIGERTFSLSKPNQEMIRTNCRHSILVRSFCPDNNLGIVCVYQLGANCESRPGFPLNEPLNELRSESDHRANFSQNIQTKKEPNCQFVKRLSGALPSPATKFEFQMKLIKLAKEEF